MPQKVGKTFSYPNARRPDDGSKALGSLSFEVKNTLHTFSYVAYLLVSFNFCFACPGGRGGGVVRSAYLAPIGPDC